MNSIERAANAIATILIREGIDYLQSKAVIKRARAQAGLTAPPEKRTSISRLTLEEELAFIDHAYEVSGATGLLLQTLLETGLPQLLHPIRQVVPHYWTVDQALSLNFQRRKVACRYMQHSSEIEMGVPSGRALGWR